MLLEDHEDLHHASFTSGTNEIWSWTLATFIYVLTLSSFCACSLILQHTFLLVPSPQCIRGDGTLLLQLLRLKKKGKKSM